MSLGAITDCLDQLARREEAARPAISLEDGEAWSYAELQDRSLRWAGALHGLGIRSGDRVALLMFNSLDYWALYLGMTRLGAIAVRVNFRLAPAELGFVLADSGAVAVCFHAELAPSLAAVRGEVPACALPLLPGAGLRDRGGGGGPGLGRARAATRRRRRAAGGGVDAAPGARRRRRC